MAPTISGINVFKEVRAPASTSSKYETIEELDTFHSKSSDDLHDASPPKQQTSPYRSLTQHKKVTTYCLALTLGILLWRYALVIVGTVASIPAFQEGFGEPYEDLWIITSSWLVIWAISTNIGLMIGAVVSSWFQDRAGRRLNLLIASLLCTASVAICYISDLPTTMGGRRALFFVGKTMQGYAVGSIMCTTQTWMSEVLPGALRGPFMALFPIFKLLGQLVGALICFSVIDYKERSAYRLCFATQ